MARRKSSPKRSNIEPAVLTMTFATPSPGAGVTGRSYIDLSQVASLVNRRFYRQGLNWAVAGFKVSSTKAGTCNLYSLPNTWVLANSWEKSMKTWMKMNREALEETQTVRPRFLDFKIYADAEHHAAGFIGNLLPISIGGVGVAHIAKLGEWDSSKIVIPDSTLVGNTLERELVAVGGNYPGNSPVTGLNAVSMIEGYAASRLLPEVLDPNAPDDAASIDGQTPANWMSAIFNEGTGQHEDVIEDMITENNVAPYPFENGPDQLNPAVPFADTMYPGGANQFTGLQWHDFVNIFETNAVNGIAIQRLKGGSFPCGLIVIDWTPVDNANLVVQLDLIPGRHRGYLAESMSEM